MLELNKEPRYKFVSTGKGFLGCATFLPPCYVVVGLVSYLVQSNTDTWKHLFKHPLKDTEHTLSFGDVVDEDEAVYVMKGNWG